MRATPEEPPGPAPDDRAAVAALLGREPRARFEVVVRDADGAPVVIRNDPLLEDGTPMPTRYYLVDRSLTRRIGTLEAAGGVRRAESEVDAAEIEATHRRYAAERDAAIPAGWAGARPSGGVGGTRRGLKCLHAHYAHHLAGGDDPVGRWVQAQLDAADSPDAGADGGADADADAGAEAGVTADAGRAGGAGPDRAAGR
jgi:hypothetical protein